LFFPFSSEFQIDKVRFVVKFVCSFEWNKVGHEERGLGSWLQEIYFVRIRWAGSLGCEWRGTEEKLLCGESEVRSAWETQKTGGPGRKRGEEMGDILGV
jgi:hypothetical protein